jgi:hypothetical protein
MRMRVGFILGFGTGYVLGSKAGRERYEQIRSTASKLMDSPQAEELKQRATEAVERVRVQFDGKTIRLEDEKQTPAPAQEPFSAAANRPEAL